MGRAEDEASSPYLTKKIGANQTNQKFFLKNRGDSAIKDDMILNIDNLNIVD